MSPLVFFLLAAGLPDRGIYPDLDDKVTIAIPADTRPADTWLRFDPTHHVLTLYAGGDPLKAWPATATGTTPPQSGFLSQLRFGLRPEDQAELARFTRAQTEVVVERPGAAEDRDGDGIVDRLDILIGARKLLFNHARYIERYVSIKFPGGDVPRSEGVCSDTVIRALRNAGIDLQKEVHDDILRAPGAYPMVEKIDASINHRRVRTILPWFQRHFRTMPAGTPMRPGDIVFLDTFPSKSGPDHLGVVSDTISASGHSNVINNWTDGAEDAEMDLLNFVPVTHHFRIASPPRPSFASH